MDLGSCELVKEFIKMENRRKQRFIKTPLKRERMAGSYSKEDSVLTRFYTSG
jgi:hypothetical protein